MPNMQEPLPENKAGMYNPLQLAYIGDTVWDLLIRTKAIQSGHNVHKMHKTTIGYVSAAGQARALERIADYLTEKEKDLVRRGRNAQPHHPVPKNQNPADYGHATGLEALIGFLYLIGDEERILELFNLAINQ